MLVAGKVADGAHGDAGQRQVDDHLRQALVPVLRRAAGAQQRDHVVRAVGVGGPQLLALEQPAVRIARGARAQPRQIGAALRLAHADAEEDISLADARQEEVELRGRAVLENQRPALPVGDPVRRHRRAAAQQLFGQHEAVKGVLAATAIGLGQRHADPAACRQRAAEVGVETHPRTRQPVHRPVAQRLFEEGAHSGAQRFGRSRNCAKCQGFDHGIQRNCRPAVSGTDSASTSNTRHSPGTPRSCCTPRSKNWIPDPAIRSLTVDETSNAPGAAEAAILAPTCTAMPLTRPARTSHSPV